MLRYIFVVTKIIPIIVLFLNWDTFVLEVAGNKTEPNNVSINDFFVTNENTEYLSNEYADIKQDIGIEKNEADIFFQKVKRQLKKQLEKVKEKGNEIIPETTFQKIINNNGHLSESIIRRVQKHGVLIVRNTISPKETLNMMSDILSYMDKNDMYQTNNFSETALEIYWSKPQMQARQHPNMIKVQKALLMDLWHMQKDNEVDVDLRFKMK